MLDCLDRRAGVVLGVLAAGLGGCKADKQAPEGIVVPFESGNPTRGDSIEVQATVSGASSTNPMTQTDIVRVVGDTLYAQSPAGTLSVVDISNPGKMELLARHRVVAKPFDLFVKDGIVIGLYQDAGDYVEDEAGTITRYARSSRVVLLDARKPREMVPVGELRVPGSLSEARLFEDRLYIASYENGFCWDCSTDGPRTVVTVFDLADPGEPAILDRIALPERSLTSSWNTWHHTVAMSEQHLYVVSPVFDELGPSASSVEVINVSPRDGTLESGNRIEIPGQVDSRWQVDEHEGTLRVVSRTPQWDTTIKPQVRTASVDDAGRLQPLGGTELELSADLESVLFAGRRAYATAGGALAVIDLRDPLSPIQGATIAMPFGMARAEARGERLVGLGPAGEDPTDGLLLSLFDVGDTESPQVLDRLELDGDAGATREGSLATGSTMSIVDQPALVLVRFGDSRQSDSERTCRGAGQTGVQIVEWDQDHDQLIARGGAYGAILPVRAQGHRQHLLTSSAQGIEAYALSDLEEPRLLDAVTLTETVDTLASASGSVVRIGQDPVSGTAHLNVLAGASPEAKILAGPVQWGGPDGCGTSPQGISVEGDLVRVLEKTECSESKGRCALDLVTVDLSQLSAPKVTRRRLEPSFVHTEVPPGMVDHGELVVQAGDALIVQHDDGEKTGVQVVSLGKGGQPSVKFVPLEAGHGTTRLVSSGTTVARSHFTGSRADTPRVRFYLDRVDVSDPERPKALPTLSIPGSLLTFHAEQRWAVTVDYVPVLKEEVTATQCHDDYVNGEFHISGEFYTEDTMGRCTALQQVLRLVRLQEDRCEVLASYPLEKNEKVGRVALGTDRLFATLLPPRSGFLTTPTTSCLACGWYELEPREAEVLVLGGMESGTLAGNRVRLEAGDESGERPLIAMGTRAVVSAGWRGRLSVIDASRVSKPKLTEELTVTTPVLDLVSINDQALGVLGDDGSEVVRWED